MDGNTMIGAMVYGTLGMNGVAQKYTPNPSKDFGIERDWCVLMTRLKIPSLTL
jgi:hypothetical protein